MLWIAAVITAVLAAGAIATAQQGSSTTPLSTVPQSSLPASYTTHGTDGSGNTIVSTTDPSIMSTNAYAWSYGNVTLPNYGVSTTRFSVDNGGTVTFQTPATMTAMTSGAHIAGVSDQQAALNALSADTGCAIAFCVAAGPNASMQAGPCSGILQAMGQLIRAGQQVPSCVGSTVNYTPATCAAPWQLVVDSWNNYECRALVAPAACPAQANAQAWSSGNYGQYQVFSGDQWVWSGIPDSLYAGTGSNGVPVGSWFVGFSAGGAFITPAQNNYSYYTAVYSGGGVQFNCDGSFVVVAGSPSGAGGGSGGGGGGPDNSGAGGSGASASGASGAAGGAGNGSDGGGSGTL